MTQEITFFDTVMIFGVVSAIGLFVYGFYLFNPFRGDEQN